MKKHGKRLLSLLFVSLLTSALIACGNQTPPAASTTPAQGTTAAQGTTTAETAPAADPTTDEVTLEWQQWWAVEAPEGYIQNIADSFYEDTGIKVKLLNAPYADTKTAIVSGHSTGTVADIVSVDGSWLYDFADQGILTNLSDLLSADGYDQSIIKQQWQALGSTYAVPIVNFAYPMFANKDILDDCGITELPKTWSEFEATCQKILDANKDYYPFALNLATDSPSGIQNTYMGFAWASGLSMKDSSGSYKLAGNEDLKEFAEFVKNLYDKGYIYSDLSFGEPDMTSRFSSGNAAFVINSMATLQTYRKEAPDMNIIAAAVPVKDGYTGKSGMCTASWALGITENSEHKAEALLFVEYLLSGADGKDGSIDADLAVTMSAFPGSALAEPDYSAADDVFKGVYDMFSNGYPENEFIGMKEANAIMVEYINALIPYLEGDVEVDVYLQNVQDAIDSVYGN